MEDNADLTDDSIRRLRILLDEINAFEGRLGEILENSVDHNINVPDGAIDEFAQIWGDFVLCGQPSTREPGEQQDKQGDFSDDCTPPNPGEIGPIPEVDPCPQDQVRCPHEVSEDER